jgi:hypothetical protein
LAASGYILRDAICRLGGNDAIAMENHRNISVSNVKGYEGTCGKIYGVYLLRPVKNLQINNMQLFSTEGSLINNNNFDIDGLQMSNCLSELPSIRTGTGLYDYGFQFKRANISNVQLNNITIRTTDGNNHNNGMAFLFLEAVVKNFTATNINVVDMGIGVKGDALSTYQNVRFNEVNVVEATTLLDMAHKNGIVFNKTATESANANLPTTSKYKIGDVVDFTDSGDGSGTGVYMLLIGDTLVKIN